MTPLQSGADPGIREQHPHLVQNLVLALLALVTTVLVVSGSDPRELVRPDGGFRAWLTATTWSEKTAADIWAAKGWLRPEAIDRAKLGGQAALCHTGDAIHEVREIGGKNIATEISHLVERDEVVGGVRVRSWAGSDENPVAVCDGDPKTAWTSRYSVSWLELDFGRVCEFEAPLMTFAYFTVQTSKDGKAWAQVSNTLRDSKGFKARYLSVRHRDNHDPLVAATAIAEFPRVGKIAEATSKY